MEQMIAVMEAPCYLVIYADRDMMPLVKKARPPSLWVITNFVEIQPEALPAFRFLDTVRKNRAEYWPTRDDRTCAETHLITCSKMHLVLDAMDKNVFGTPRFLGRSQAGFSAIFHAAALPRCREDEQHLACPTTLGMLGRK
jgi:hypothetical protein